MSMSHSIRDIRQPVKRRIVLGALAGFVTPSGDLPVENTYRRIAEALGVLSAAMAEVHGGQWSAHVDHDAGFILISPQRVPGQPLG